MKLAKNLLVATAMSLVAVSAVSAEEITIATVNNGDMITMQGKSVV